MRVSVYCTVYNHSQYLRDALEGFVNQKVNFNYEVFVHDDASTDNSVEIIKEYATKYPDIIKPIYQKENQYSQGISIFKNHLYPKMTGKYIAICEGDDYWSDPNKLQKQVDFLDNNSDYSACVHNSLMLDLFKNNKKIMYEKEDKDLTIGDVITGGGSCYHTSSLLYRYEYGKKDAEFFEIIQSIGDYPMAVYLSLNGKIKYFKDVMSVYRYGSENSWSMKCNSDITKVIKLKKEKIKFLNTIDQYTKGKHQNVIQPLLIAEEFKIKELSGSGDIFKIEKLKNIYNQKTIPEKIKINIKYYFYKEYLWIRKHYYGRGK